MGRAWVRKGQTRNLCKYTLATTLALAAWWIKPRTRISSEILQYFIFYFIRVDYRLMYYGFTDSFNYSQKWRLTLPKFGSGLPWHWPRESPNKTEPIQIIRERIKWYMHVRRNWYRWRFEKLEENKKERSWMQLIKGKLTKKN
jgi:hypothetical protein